MTMTSGMISMCSCCHPFIFVLSFRMSRCSSKLSDPFLPSFFSFSFLYFTHLVLFSSSFETFYILFVSRLEGVEEVGDISVAVAWPLSKRVSGSQVWCGDCLTQTTMSSRVTVTLAFTRRVGR